ncbi:SPOR domain-containing protein [Roseicyclus sp.]|uniref:SPOR domain-containing protein n=1 Tax=Roseicyclus sp. TaxID=1914329 RepID=UPI003F9F323A
MAVYGDEFDGYGAGTSPRAERSSLGALLNWTGALVSLGLVVGMGVWGVQLMLRDVSGVPVIQALEGPMRVAPADPGGTQAPHQGLAVNRIAEGEEAQPVPDRLVLAPPPVELQEIRFEAASTAEAAPEAAPGPAPRPEAADVAAVATEAAGAPEAEEPVTAAETMALIDRLLREAQAGDPGAAAEEAPVQLAGVIPASVPGVAVSLRPAVRPAAVVRSDQGRAPSVTLALASAPTTVEIAAADLPEGTRLVQLGAYDTVEVARGEWDRLAARFPDYFADRPRVIEEAASGGQTFFRLRAGGFDDLSGSRRFCAVLVAQGAACIPVTVR